MAAACYAGLRRRFAPQVRAIYGNTLKLWAEKSARGKYTGK